MEFIEEDGAEFTIVVVAGRLDSQTAGRFSGRLSELYQSREAQVLIELSRLTYISSAGCRALYLAARQATERGRLLGVCGMNEAVERVVELAGLGSQVRIYDSREEALAQMSAV
jgi:anti-anti-sigma factor